MYTFECNYFEKFVRKRREKSPPIYIYIHISLFSPPHLDIPSFEALSETIKHRYATRTIAWASRMDVKSHVRKGISATTSKLVFSVGENRTAAIAIPRGINQREERGGSLVP